MEAASDQEPMQLLEQPPEQPEAPPPDEVKRKRGRPPGF